MLSGGAVVCTGQLYIRLILARSTSEKSFALPIDAATIKRSQEKKFGDKEKRIGRLRGS